MRVVRCALVALVLAAAAGCGGCVAVHITDVRGETRAVWNLGMVKVEAQAPEAEIVGVVSGLGVVSAPLSWSVGFTRQRWALIGKGCKVIVWPEGGVLDEAIRERLDRIATVCVMDK